MAKYFKSHGHYDLTKGLSHRFWKRPFYKITNQILSFTSRSSGTPAPTPTATPTPTPSCDSINLVGVNANTSGDSITKTSAGGWDGSAYSTKTYSCPVSVTFKTSTSDSYLMGGFSYNPTANSETYTNTTYGLYIQTGFLEIYEGGGQVNVPGSISRLQNDTWKVDYDGTNVKYYQNGNLIYTSSNSVTQPLHVFFALLTPEQVVTDICVRSITPTPTPTPTPTIHSAYTSPTNNSNVSIVSQSPFVEGNSYYFPPSPGNGYLSVEGSDFWAVGTGDFTIEWFQYQTDNNPFPRILQVGSYPTTSIGCSIEGFPMGTFYVWCSGANSFGEVSVKNSWHHFAIVRRSSQLYVYKNGIQLGSSISNSTNITNSNTELYIGVENAGENPSTFFEGYMTNIRWVKGLAVYTGNFTKPESSLTAIASVNPYGGSNTQEIPAGYTKLLLVP